MKNNYSYGFLFLLVTMILLSTLSSAQGVLRQNIGSLGTSKTKDGSFSSVSQTIGQPYSTVIFQNGAFFVNPGFQQSLYFANQKNNQNNSENNGTLKKTYHDLKIYPNPATDNIYFDTKIKKGSLQVYNMQGKQILTKKIYYPYSAPVNCSSWISGPYMILVYDKSENKHYKAKVLISK